MSELTAGQNLVQNPFLQEAEAQVVAGAPTKPINLYLKWKATKGTPIKVVEDGTFKAYVDATGIQYGLTHFNKEARKDVQITDSISFVFLTIAARMQRDGYVDGEHAKNGAYSNYVADTRTQKFVVRLPKDYGGGVIFDGFYKDFKENVNGCRTPENDFLRYSAIGIFYIPELQMIAEIESSTFMSAMCAAVQKHTGATKEVEKFHLGKFEYEHYRFVLEGIDFVNAKSDKEKLVAPKFRIVGINPQAVAYKKDLQKTVIEWLTKSKHIEQPQQQAIDAGTPQYQQLPETVTPKPTIIALESYERAIAVLGGNEKLVFIAKNPSKTNPENTRLDYELEGQRYAFQVPNHEVEDIIQNLRYLPF